MSKYIHTITILLPKQFVWLSIRLFHSKFLIKIMRVLCSSFHNFLGFVENQHQNAYVQLITSKIPCILVKCQSDCQHQKFNFSCSLNSMFIPLTNMLDKVEFGWTAFQRIYTTLNYIDQQSLLLFSVETELAARNAILILYNGNTEYRYKHTRNVWFHCHGCIVYEIITWICTICSCLFNPNQFPVNSYKFTLCGQ